MRRPALADGDADKKRQKKRAERCLPGDVAEHAQRHARLPPGLDRRPRAADRVFQGIDCFCRPRLRLGRRIQTVIDRRRQRNIVTHGPDLQGRYPVRSNSANEAGDGAPPAGESPLAAVLTARVVTPVSYQEWLRIETAERDLAKALGRGDRVKLPGRDAIWSACRP